MQMFRFMIASMLIASLSITDASAFTVDQGGGRSAGAAHLSDPEDAIPFPHIADDGQVSQGFGTNLTGNGTLSFGVTSTNAQPDAFGRAQDRMGQ